MNDINSIDTRIEGLEKALAHAKQTKADLLKARRDSVTPIWEYTVKPVRGKAAFDRIYDPTCNLYRIEGRCLNKAELEEVGYSTNDYREGGMTYIYNTLSHFIVTSIGGGTAFIGLGSSAFGDVDAHMAAIEEVSNFIWDNPEGGVINDIVARYKAAVTAAAAARRK